MNHPPPAGDTAQALECPAYPRAVRVLAAVLLIDLLIAGLWTWPALREATWTVGGLAVWGLALLCCICLGGWVVVSRTRLQDGELTQTWLWTHKRVHARDVAHVKLVHLAWLASVLSPRLLVRRRQGGMTWFHASNPQLLTQFMASIPALQAPAAPGRAPG